MRTRHILALSVPCVLFAIQSGAWGQDGSTPPNTTNKKTPIPRETVSRPMTEREKKKNDEKLRKELETPYKKWLEEDVVWIISDEERKAFKQLQTDEERQAFIEAFWLRRDPSPDTEENEYKEEHYRRMAYADERFASGIPGWKTDRGKIYIMFGPPDEIDAHSSGGTYDRPIEEGGGTTSTFPFEKWRYRYLEGVGTDINIEFVDTTMTGEYHMTMDPSEKDALQYVPGAGLTWYEQMGLACKSQRFTRTDGNELGVGNMPLPASMNEFTRLEQFVNLQKAPAIKFKDLESLVTSTIKFNILPLKLRTDYIPITESSVLTAITVQFDRKDLQFKDKDGVSTATIELHGGITTMTHRPVPGGTFDQELNIPLPTEMLQKGAQGAEIYQKTLFLPPGRYKLEVLAKDMVGQNAIKQDAALDVPRLDDDRLSSSSLILADVLESIPTKKIGSLEPFIIAGYKVRPQMNASFSHDGPPMGIYIKLYNFEPDEVTKKPNGTIQYEVIKNGTNETVIDFSEEVATLIDPRHPGSAAELVVQHLLPLKSLEPGQYTLKLTVVDNKRKQTLTPSATFTITGAAASAVKN
jgi:GWxTD domain-containing protein